MSRPKLFLLCPSLQQGGFERVCVTSAHVLADLYDITVVLFNDREIAFDTDGLHIVNLNVPAAPGMARKVLNVFKRTRLLKKLLRSEHPDIVYSFGPTANRINNFAKTRGSQVWVGIRSFMDFADPKSLGSVVRRADTVIACSREIEMRLREDFRVQSIHTLYNLYDLKTIEEKSHKEIPFPWGTFDDKNRKIRNIIALGRCDDAKSYWHMLLAFYLAQNQIPEARLTIVGDGDYSDYRRMAEELGIEEKVYFPGFSKDPYAYLRAADLYLLTSRNEGFPNCLVEGMSLGLPAIATNCMTGPAEILIDDPTITVAKAASLLKKEDGTPTMLLADYGILVPDMTFERNTDTAKILAHPEDAEEKICAEAIIKLLTDNELYAKYSDCAKKRAADFSYEHYRETFDSFVRMHLEQK